MTLDELEALRLAHLEELYQADAARRMGISRSTFGRILEAAHRKMTEALVRGRALRVEGGVVTVAGPPRCSCRDRQDPSAADSHPHDCPGCGPGQPATTPGKACCRKRKVGPQG